MALTFNMIALAFLVTILSGCYETDRYPNAESCGEGEYIMKRSEGFSTERWNAWCDAYGVSS